MFDQLTTGMGEQDLYSGGALDPAFNWPELENPLPGVFDNPDTNNVSVYFTEQRRIINDIKTYKQTLTEGKYLLGMLDREIARRDSQMLQLSMQSLLDCGLSTPLEAVDQEKFTRFHLFLVTECGFSAHQAAELIVTNLEELVAHTSNGDTLATLTRVVVAYNPQLSEQAVRQKILTFILNYLPHNVPSAHDDIRASVEVPIAQSYTVQTSKLPYPFLDQDDGKKALFEGLIRTALVEHQPTAQLTIREAGTLTREQLERYGRLRGNYFGGRKGWIVPDLDIDRHDTRPETSHFELDMGPDDEPGYARRLRIHPQELLDLTTDEVPSMEDITRSLRSLDAMPFPNPEYYELDTDVRELAKRVPTIEGMVKESALELDYSPAVHYSGTTEQVALAIQQYLSSPTPVSDPILKRFIELLAGIEPGKLNIIERLIPPFMKLKLPSMMKPVVGTAAMIIIMTEAAAEALRRNETLWLFQTDAEFKQHLEQMFGESAVRVVAHISQVKRDVKVKDAVKYVADDCFTILIDIKQALTNVLNSNSTPTGFGEFALSLISERDPDLATALRAEWTTAHAPISVMANDLAMLSETPYHEIES